MSASNYNIRLIFNNFHPLVKIVFDILMVLFVFFISFLIGGMILSQIFGMPLTELLKSTGVDGDIRILKASQIMYSIALFMLPALVVAFFFDKNPFKYTGLTKSAYSINYLNAIMLMFLALPIVNVLASVNGHIHLPQSMAAIEQSFIEMEQKAKVLTEKLLSGTDIKTLMLNLFMIALLPAIGEELFFRSIFQKHLIELVKNEHIGILIAAIFFSAFHFQFLTFLPRVFLGILLGYLFVWSKSLWLSIVAHFTNNAMAVIVMYIAHKNNLNIDSSLDNFGSSPQTFFYTIISLLMLSLTLYFIYRNERNKNLSLK